jgi:hypothetical protein
VEAVAAGDVVALQPLFGAVLAPGDVRVVAVDVVRLHGLGFENDVQAARGRTFEQVVHDLLLAVDGDRSTGQFAHVDAENLAVQGDVGAFMHQPLRVHARTQAEAVQQIDRHPFEHAGAYAPLHILARAVFENDGVDTGAMQEMPQKQSGRAAADDGDLCAHGSSRKIGLCGQAGRVCRRTAGMTMDSKTKKLDFSKAGARGSAPGGSVESATSIVCAKFFSLWRAAAGCRGAVSAP